MPNLGRWLNREPLQEVGGINLYAYVEGDPMGYVDPAGLFKVCKHSLDGIKSMSSGSTGLNLGIFHEHGFFEDGSGDNIGFGEQGTFLEKSIDGYSCDGSKKYDDSIMREAYNNIRLDWMHYKYNVAFNNCQDFMDALDEEYERIQAY